MLLGLSACSNDLKELEQKVVEIRSKPGIRVQPLPEIKPYEAFKYEASTERSPFLSYVAAQSMVATTQRPDVKRKREFLEQFPLDTLTMVGTLEINGKNYGLVQDNTGLIHRVLVGNFIGQADGKITSITGNKISVTEILADGLGGYIERPATLTLKE
jgi:type IV pilus assembly protein PilP